MSDPSSEQKTPAVGGLSKNVITLGLVSFLNDLSSDMIFPFIPIFLTSVLGAGATFVGVVEGVADATASLVKIISGALSDRWRKRKPFVVLGYAISAFAKPLLGLAAAPWHVLGLRFFDRAGKGTRDAPRDALISFSTEKKYIGRAFGFHRGADTLGAAFGPLIAFAVLPLLGGNLRSLFFLSAIASLIAVAVLWAVVREAPRVADGEIEHQKFEWRYLGGPFVIFLVAVTLFSLGKASEAFLLLRARDVGVALVFLPIIYFVYNITFALFSTPVGMLSDKIGRRNTFMIGMLLFSGSYILFAEVGSGWIIWFLFPLYGLYSAFTEGVGRAIVADLIEERWRATAYGMYSALTGVALLPASVIFGVLWDWKGAAFAFWYGAVLGLLALVLFFFLRVRRQVRDGALRFLGISVEQ